jgi:hypothetical protein
MASRLLRKTAGVVGVLFAWCAAETARAQPLLNTDNLCGPGTGNIGTSWISLPSEGLIRTAEDLCTSTVPMPQTVTQVFPDGTGRYTYDCATMTCTSSGPIPEPGCTASTCFCLSPGEGVSIRTSAPSQLDVYGCDAPVPVNIQIATGPGLGGSIVSVPYRTFLTTFNDLGLWYGLPSTGIQRGTVTALDCTTGVLSAPCQIGTAACQAALLKPGLAYRLSSPVSATYSATNPVACLTPNPTPADCPIDGLTVTSGTTNTLNWNPAPVGCTLPLTYQVARFDLDCMLHYCRNCASCSIIGTTTVTTLADTPPMGTNWGYLVSVVGGTWNETANALCIDRDVMFALGCP